MKKRGQVAIFVIVALVLIAVILVSYFYPQIRSQVSKSVDPNKYLKDCIEPDIRKDISILGSQGSYANPEGSVQYGGREVKYLCYSSEYYKTCYIQQPMIRQHFEQELKKMLDVKAKECFSELKQYYEKKGYDVSNSNVETNISIIPNKVIIGFIAPMTITKESSQTFNGFNVEINSEIYDLIMISTSIVDYEAAYGDSETLIYLQYYPNIKIQKDQLSEGTTIYNVSHVITKENFMFASRSVAWPAGYGWEEGGLL